MSPFGGGPRPRLRTRNPGNLSHGATEDGKRAEVVAWVSEGDPFPPQRFQILVIIAINALIAVCLFKTAVHGCSAKSFIPDGCSDFKQPRPFLSWPVHVGWPCEHAKLILESTSCLKLLKTRVKRVV